MVRLGEAFREEISRDTVMLAGWLGS